MDRLHMGLAAKGKLWARVVSVQGDQVILAVADRRLTAKTTVPLTEGDVVSLAMAPATDGGLPLRVMARREGGVSPENAGLPQVVVRLPVGVKPPRPGEVILARVLEAKDREGVLRFLGVDSPAVSDVPLATGDVLPLLWEGSGGERAMLRLLPPPEEPPVSKPSLGGALERAGWPVTGGNLVLARALRVAGLPVNGQELAWLNRVADSGAGAVTPAAPTSGSKQASAPLAKGARPAGGNWEGILEAARIRAENPALPAQTLVSLSKLVLNEDLGKRLARILPKEEFFYQPGNGGQAGDLARVVSALYGGSGGNLLAQAGPAARELATVLLYQHLLSVGNAVCVGIPLVWAKEPGSAQLRVEKEAPGRKVNPKRTVVRLSMETPRLGPLQVVLDFSEKHLNVKFTANGDDSIRLLADRAGLLQNGLGRLAFKVGTLRFTTVAAEDAEEEKSLDQRV